MANREFRWANFEEGLLPSRSRREQCCQQRLPALSPLQAAADNAALLVERQREQSCLLLELLYGALLVADGVGTAAPLVETVALPFKWRCQAALLITARRIEI